MKPVRVTIRVNGPAIRELRLAAGIDSLDLAQKAGIDRSYLLSIETGRRPRMGPAKFEALRRALGVEREQILAEDAA